MDLLTFVFALGGCVAVAGLCSLIQALWIASAPRRKALGAWFDRKYLDDDTKALLAGACAHPEPELIPIYNRHWGLVATLCPICEGQLEPAVWQKKMDRELAELDAPPVRIVANSITSDSFVANTMLPVEPDLTGLAKKLADVQKEGAELRKQTDALKDQLKLVCTERDAMQDELMKPPTRVPTGEKTMEQVLRGWKCEMTESTGRMTEITLTKGKWFARMPISEEVAQNRFDIIRAVDHFLNVLEDKHPEMFEDQKPALSAALNGGFMTGMQARQLVDDDLHYADRMEYAWARRRPFIKGS